MDTIVERLNQDLRTALMRTSGSKNDAGAKSKLDWIIFSCLEIVKVSADQQEFMSETVTAVGVIPSVFISMLIVSIPTVTTHWVSHFSFANPPHP